MRRAAWLLGLVLLAVPAAAQDSHLLVIVGLSGDPDNAARFHRWAVTLVDAARDRSRLARESVVYLAEDPARDPARIAGRSTRENIEAAVNRLAARAVPGDRVFVVLIGHGAASAREPRFNLPGPDLSAREFDGLLKRFGAQVVTVVNTASASGGFVPVLAGPNRTVIAATKTEGERNQTRFGEFFAEALSGLDADLDKDGAVSMLEAFTWARRRVVESYEREGQLLTEHAVLDDDGDGKGSDAPGAGGTEGRLARTLFLAGSAEAADEGGVDPALRDLYEERRAIEARLAALKAAKDGMSASDYEQQMERVLVELARANRAIREKEKP